MPPRPPTSARVAFVFSAFATLATVACGSPSPADGTEDELSKIPSEIVGSYSSPRGAIELRKNGTYRGGYIPSYYDAGAYDATAYAKQDGGVDASSTPAYGSPKAGVGAYPNELETPEGALRLMKEEPAIIQNETGTFRVTSSQRIDGILQGTMIFRPDNAPSRISEFEVLPNTGLHVITGMDNQIWHVADDQIWHREM